MERITKLQNLVRNDRTASWIVIQWSQEPRDGDTRDETERLAEIMNDTGALRHALEKAGWTPAEIKGACA